jgi:hypothetical protein
MVDQALLGTATSAERTVVTYLKPPVATPLARVRRVFFEETYIIFMESKIDVHERLCATLGGQRGETNPTKTARIATEAHDIFRSGLSQCLDALVKATLGIFGKLVKIAVSHTEWMIDDPAEWARCRMMELLDERLSAGTSGLPTVDRWFRWACDGDPIEMESAGFIEPWCAPVVLPLLLNSRVAKWRLS